MSNKTAILKVRLAEEQLNKLIKYANSLGLTRSKLISKIIDNLPD
ncbi:MAG: hypothetical protein ACKO2Z_16080 [Sphaerospermopsis kisseleviana]